MNRDRALLALLFATAVAGCTRSPVGGFFNAQAYYSGHQVYRVRYAPERSEVRSTLPSEWTLQNFSHDDQGRPRDLRPDAVFHTAFQMRYLHPRFSHVPPLDFPRFDMLYGRGGEDGSAIYARTVLLPAAWAEISAEDLLREGVAGLVDDRRAPDVWGFARPSPGTQLVIHRETRALLDGERGYFSSFDLVSPSGERIRATLIAVRRSVDLHIRRGGRIPALLVFGYVSTVDAHREDEATFGEWLGRVDLAPVPPGSEVADGRI